MHQFKAKNKRIGSKYNKDFINNSIFKSNTCIFLACCVDKDIVFPKKCVHVKADCMSQYPL